MDHCVRIAGSYGRCKSLAGSERADFRVHGIEFDMHGSAAQAPLSCCRKALLANWGCCARGLSNSSGTPPVAGPVKITHAHGTMLRGKHYKHDGRLRSRWRSTDTLRALRI